MTIVFGLTGPKKQITWYQPLMQFPTLIMYQNTKWEWVTYDKDHNSEYILTFSEVMPYNPNYNVDAPNFEKMFEISIDNSCVCGSIYTSFPQFHMFYCPKHLPWDKI